jgi:hypothetical protein
VWNRSSIESLAQDHDRYPTEDRKRWGQQSNLWLWEQVRPNNPEGIYLLVSEGHFLYPSHCMEVFGRLTPTFLKNIACFCTMLNLEDPSTRVLLARFPTSGSTAGGYHEMRCGLSLSGCWNHLLIGAPRPEILVLGP